MTVDNIFVNKGGNGVLIDSVRRSSFYNIVSRNSGGCSLKIAESGSTTTINNDYKPRVVNATSVGVLVTSAVAGDGHDFLDGSWVISSGGTGIDAFDIQTAANRINIGKFTSYKSASDNDLNVVSGNDVRLYAADMGHASGISGTPKTYNMVGTESANAETPQDTYPMGALVDFTNTGDGSGTGVYMLLQDGTWRDLNAA